MKTILILKSFFLKYCCRKNITFFSIYMLVFLIVFLSNLYSPNFIQKFWCMGYAESLALSRPFSFYAETITVAPSPIALGLPHVYLMSLLVRMGISSYSAYHIMMGVWVFLSMFCCYKLIRMLSLEPILAVILPLFLIALPAITMHQHYSALGIGYVLIPFYVWAAAKLFQAKSLKEKILPSGMFAIAMIIALFMDGYSFMMGLMIIGAVYLVFFKHTNWRLHLFYDPLIIVLSCLIAYFLYSRFIGGSSFNTYPRNIFTLFQAKIVSYFIPIERGFSILGDYFAYRFPYRLDYFQDFLFCLPLLAVNLILFCANKKFLLRRWEYWLIWFMILAAFWLSMGPDITLPLSGKTVPSGNWFIYNNLPGFKVMRATARWGILVNILLVVMLYVSLVRSEMKGAWLAVMLTVLYFFQYCPSPNFVANMKRARFFEQKTRKVQAKDLRKKLHKGETILFLPIRNSFSHLYFGSLHGVNTWNTGCDKNVAMLSKAYPKEIISPLTANTYEINYVSHLDLLSTVMAIVNILLHTEVDTIVFDYNSICPISKYPYRNPLKKDADKIEALLKKFDFITIDHSQYFAYYRIDKSKKNVIHDDSIRNIEILLFKQFAYKVPSLDATITMDCVKDSSVGFYNPQKKGCWASSHAKLALKLENKWFLPDKELTVNFLLHNNTKPQTVEIYSEKRLLRSTKIIGGQLLTLSLKPQWLDKDGVLFLEFKFPDAFHPPRDSRILSCFFQNISLAYSLKVIPWEKSLPVNVIHSFLSGFYCPEPHGKWAGKDCMLNLPLQSNKNDVWFFFEGHPLHSKQFVKIKNKENQVMDILDLPIAGKYKVFIPAANISKDNILSLRLEFPEACRPKGGDQRILSFFFRNIKLSPDKKHKLQVGSAVYFNTANYIAVKGFSSVEKWGTWSNAKDCFMRFSLPENRKSETVHLQFTCQAYAKMKSVKIYCNGKYVSSWDILNHLPTAYELNLKIPLSEQNVELRFEQFDVASPYEINKANDHRKLGMGFISMKYLPETNFEGGKQ